MSDVFDKAKRSEVMSLIRGASRHPDSLTRFLMSSGAPHDRQATAVGSFWVWHHWQTMRERGRADGSLIGAVAFRAVSKRLASRESLSRPEKKSATNRVSGPWRLGEGKPLRG